MLAFHQWVFSSMPSVGMWDGFGCQVKQYGFLWVLDTYLGFFHYGWQHVSTENTTYRQVVCTVWVIMQVKWVWTHVRIHFEKKRNDSHTKALVKALALQGSLDMPIGQDTPARALIGKYSWWEWSYKWTCAKSKYRTFWVLFQPEISCDTNLNPLSIKACSQSSTM